jgi:phosphoribosylformylglycinamidine synthase subunit PurQ / glutaminase
MSAPRVAVVVFPGTWSDRDFLDVAPLVGWDARPIWHAERELGGVDAVVLPGGFAHGDYLRTGAIARFSPIMPAIESFAASGGAVLGSCNGFQILCEAGMLPGALLRNDHLEFRCDWQWLRVEAPASCPMWLGQIADGRPIRLPISHGEGRYYADGATLSQLEATHCVVLRYADADGRVTPDANPNGSLHGIAGITNGRGNVLGLMPHPERAAEEEVGGSHGLLILRSLVAWLAEQPVGAERRL